MNTHHEEHTMKTGKTKPAKTYEPVTEPVPAKAPAPAPTPDKEPVKEPARR